MEELAGGSRMRVENVGEGNRNDGSQTMALPTKTRRENKMETGSLLSHAER
jgi:hypothetical protein